MEQHEIRTLQDLFEYIRFYGRLWALFMWKEGKEWKKIRRSDFVDKVHDCAAYLQHECAVLPGDRVAFMIHNGPEWHSVRFAAILIGAVVVPIVSEASDHDLGVILKKSKPKIVITKTDGSAAILRRAASRANLDVCIWVYTFAMTHAAGKTYQPHKVSEHDPAMIFFTSGTTSDPKGVVHTHKSIISNMRQAAQCFPTDAGDILLSFLSPSHIFQHSVDMVALMQSAKIAYIENIFQIRSAFQEIHPTCMAVIPKMLESIRNLMEDEIAKQSGIKKFIAQATLTMGLRRYSSRLWDHFLARLTDPFLKPIRAIAKRKIFGNQMRFLVNGGFPLDKELGMYLQERTGVPIVQGYGSNETAGAITCNRLKKNIMGSCGIPFPESSIELDAHDEIPFELREKGAGEIVVQGTGIMQGYLEEPEATQKVLRPNGYYTGDIGMLGKNESLYLVGRLRGFIILNNGLKIWPDSLGNRIRLHCPLIEHIVLFGDNKDYLVALVSTKKDAGPGTEAEIMKVLKSLPLAPHERVKKIALFPKPLSTEDDTLTIKQQPKIRVIERLYKDLIDSLYQ